MAKICLVLNVTGMKPRLQFAALLQILTDRYRVVVVVRPLPPPPTPPIFSLFYPSENGMSTSGLLLWNMLG